MNIIAMTIETILHMMMQNDEFAKLYGKMKNHQGF